MISRSVVIGALVVVELAIVGEAVRTFSGAGPFKGNVAWASEAPAAPLDRTFSAGEAPHVVIDVGSVDVEVRTASAADVHVVETMHGAGFFGDRLVPVTTRQTADGVRIAQAPGGDVHFVLGMLERSVRLTVPSGARIEVLSAGDVTAEGLRAPLSAHSDNGAIRVRDHRGDLALTTANGRIELHDVQGRTLAMTSHNGRIVLDRVGAERLDAGTGNGRVEATALRVVDGTVVSSHGPVRLALAENSDATVTAHTANGRVHVRDLQADDDETSSSERVVRLGGGRGRFDVTAANGSITLSEGARV
jgi:hypothetical protein